MDKISIGGVITRDKTAATSENINKEESEDVIIESRKKDHLNPVPERDNEQKKTCSESCMNFFKNITVEPTVSLFIVAYLISGTAITNLSLEKACRVNLNFTDDICSDMRQQKLNSQNEYERDAQKLVSNALALKSYFTATIPCLLALFVGPWQDKTGHGKIFFIVTIFCQMLSNVNSMVNVYFLNELNLQVLVFSDGLIEALSGGICVPLLTVFAFISAITTAKSRTFRIGMVNFCINVSYAAGAALSGFLLKNLGYYGAFSIALSIHGINLLYSLLVLKAPERNIEHKKHDNKGVGHFFRTFFDLANVRDALLVIFKKGPSYRRLRMIVLLLLDTSLYGPEYGEVAVLYLSTRYRFKWDEVSFSLFQAYNLIVHSIGTVFSIAVLSKLLQWNDSLLGMISTFSKVAASFVYCFARTGNIFYISPVVEIMSGTSWMALRSIVSKIVASDELGKANSIFGLVENLMPLVYVPLFTKVYSSTMEMLPGAVFLVGGAMTVPAVVVFTILFVEHRLKLKKK